MNSSIKTRAKSGSRRCATSGDFKSAAIRRSASRSSAGVSARMTPRLPESTSGFTTQGNGIDTSSRSTRSRGTTWKRGTGKPAARSRSRLCALLRAAATEPTGLCGRPSFSEVSAATNAVWSSTPMIARGWRAPTLRANSAAARSGSRMASAIVPSARWWHTSDAAITSTSSLCAAATKSSLR